MGLANLVPGISGGTMLLAAGVYPQFIQSVAEVTTLRFQPRSLLLLACVLGAASIAIMLLAGPTKELVVHQRWIMYSLFVGLTVGGVPVVWRLLRPLTATAGVGCGAGILMMVAGAIVQPGGVGPSASGSHAYGLLFMAGVAGASAMILPGLSGGYILLLLGQYVTILGAVESVRAGLMGGGAESANWPQVAQAMHVFLPVALGIGVGMMGVSNLMRMLLSRFEKATLGLLMGLLLGAVLGLWPFQQPVRPLPGDRIKSQIMTAESIDRLDPKDYPLERFFPSGRQIAAVTGLILAGFLIAHGVALSGRLRRESPSSTRAGHDVGNSP